MRETLLAIANHSYWATKKVLLAAEELTPEQWAAPERHGQAPGLRARLVHCLDAERGWRNRFQTAPPSWGAKLAETDFSRPADLTARWLADERDMRGWLHSLDEQALLAPTQLRQRLPLWNYLAQVFLHSTQHRAEAALILTELGRSPRELDFLYWAESPEAAGATAP